MAFTNEELLTSLYAPTTIPIVPFKNGDIDISGHTKNIEYLMNHNYLDNGRKRVISVAGTSLIHHIEPRDQTQLFDTMGEVMGNDGLLMSAVVPTPVSTAGDLVETQSALRRAPDVYLIMPLGGIYSPEGMYEGLFNFGETYGSKCGARFIYYFRQSRDRDFAIQLLNESKHFVGVKIGTGVEDVQPFINGVGNNAMVIWGIGDRSTAAAKIGAKGHTSGTAIVCARIADEINNAQRCGDYTRALELEELIAPLEEIRFRDGRKYNYSAVVEAINVSGYDDIVGGEGGPFNPRVPAAVQTEIERAIEKIRDYH